MERVVGKTAHRLGQPCGQLRAACGLHTQQPPGTDRNRQPALVCLRHVCRWYRAAGAVGGTELTRRKRAYAMILLSLLLLPFFAGLLCWQITRADEDSQVPRWIALVTMAFLLLLCLWQWIVGDYTLGAIGSSPDWQLETNLRWIPSMGISLHLAMDGLSLIMVALTSFLGILAVLCSWKEITDRVGFFHLNLLWVLGGVVGV